MNYNIQCIINIDILQLDTQGYANLNYRNPFIFNLVFNTKINLYCEHFDVQVAISVIFQHILMACQPNNF